MEGTGIRAAAGDCRPLYGDVLVVCHFLNMAAESDMANVGAVEQQYQRTVAHLANSILLTHARRVPGDPYINCDCEIRFDLIRSDFRTAQSNLLLHRRAAHNVDVYILILDLLKHFDRSEERRVGKECRLRWATKADKNSEEHNE